MISTANILQILVGGLTTGAVYAMIALGLVIVFNVTRVINLAQGEFFTLGAFTVVTLHATLKVPLWLSFLCACAVAAIAAVLMERIAIRPLRKSSPSIQLLMTVGLSSIVQGGVALIWGMDPVSIPQYWKHQPFHIAGAAIDTQSILVLGAILCLSAVLWLFFAKTTVGKAMQACAENPTAAQLIGLSVNQIRRGAFALSGFLGALSGLLILPMMFADYQIGMLMSIKAFMAAAFGGMGSTLGAVVGGLALGLLESVSAGFISSQFKDSLAFVAVLLLLSARPKGLLGRFSS